MPGDVTFEGSIGFSQGPLGLTAGVNGWINSSGFLGEGNGAAYVQAFGKRVDLAGAGAVLSSTGLAACGGYRIPTFFGTIKLQVGFGWRWGTRLAERAGRLAATSAASAPARRGRPPPHRPVRPR